MSGTGQNMRRLLLLAGLLVVCTSGCAALHEKFASVKSPGTERVERKEKFVADFEQRRSAAEFSAAVESADRGDVATSRQMLQALVARQPNYSAAHVKLAELHWLSGNRLAAETELTAAIATAGERADIHHALGILLEAMNRAEQSKRHLALAAQLEPGNELYRMSAPSSVASVGFRTPSPAASTANVFGN